MGSKSTEVGRTGARFASPGGGHGRHTPDAVRSEAPQPEAEPPESAQHLTGARFGPHSERRRKRDLEFEPFPPGLDHQPPARPDPSPTRSGIPPVERLPLESDILIRPYARTGGRTKPSRTLALEALITTSSDLTGIGSRHWSWEHRMIANLCVHPRSVAEVAALLAIPLGVARILVGDMATDGTVVIHGSAGHRPPDIMLMQRVLAGLRSL
ncbi:MAG TPA: DUF742 domain-containing protein [Actinophytocola sp.]|uniref:DUF742 domain-containing protein n=1 Tax=Actinophytocola sp. TaxID=1872138 RepID=UPI002DBA2BB0|nr:DUF742 domain-containing protein [Actinophytocola sp.]HEU5472556.1 DUF742 domain-containing protein [Actinophytocola sp.]